MPIASHLVFGMVMQHEKSKIVALATPTTPLFKLRAQSEFGLEIVTRQHRANVNTSPTLNLEQVDFQIKRLSCKVFLT